MNRLVLAVSACLCNEPCRYNATPAPVPEMLARALASWKEKGRLLLFCPEVAGGLDTPRSPCEIIGKNGGDGVLAGSATLRNGNGDDLTAPFLAGARLFRETLRSHGIHGVLLKENSPSCGVHRIYDGNFSGTRIPGQGVAAALLAKEGFRLWSEEKTGDLFSFMETTV